MFEYLAYHSERYSAGAFHRQKGPAVLRSGIYKSCQDPIKRRVTDSFRPLGQKLVDPYPSRPYTVQRITKYPLQPQRTRTFKLELEGESLSREDYFPGLIFRAPFYEESYDQNLDPKYLIQDGKYGSICRKVRKFIVVACYEESYVAVPLYTFNGNGLGKKVAEAKDQYVSVHDHRSKSPPLQLSRHEPLITGSLEPDVYLYKDSTVCHITGVHSRWYKSRVLKEGYLSRDSIERLRQLPTAVERREISCNSPY